MRSRLDDSADLPRRTLLGMAVIAPTLVAGIAGAAEPAPAGTADLPPDLATAIKQHEQATFRNDIVALGKLVADDYLLVNSDSTLQNKQSYLADFAVPGFKLDPYVMEEPVQKIWGDTALSAGRLHLTWTQDGKRQDRRVRIVHVWTKEDGHWRLKYTQLTRMT
ncbi:nuclear transport factor 2 family protein [Steroidobacter agaridevorans]|nr:nuclear transport factor 2 family protein [Steroidobacter agaridevorans]